MTLSILHISDLHRDPAHPIHNDVLLDSLESDLRRYTTDETPRIRPPDIIIVSGDLIHGIKHDDPNPDAALAAQYAEALAFLNALADRMLNNDKRRLIVVPGNHDISAYHFIQSIRKIDIAPDRKKDLISQLFSPNSILRWSWSDLSLYEITNAVVYEERLSAFSSFYETFYDGTRTYDLSPSKQFDIFDVPDLALTIVGFCSCYNNDIFNKQGSIHPVCIADAAQALRQSAFQDRIKLAVWHHNTEGLPMQFDYMDPDILQNLIDRGFSLGFHGHQHKPQFLDCRYRHGGERKITVLSAGTLCGGAAFRFARAYNVVLLNIPERTGQLHVREMQNDNLALPIWGARPLPPHTEAFLNFTFDSPPAPPARPDKETSILLQAQRLIDSEKYSNAIQLLLELGNTVDLARPLLLACYVNSHDTAGLVANFDPPQSTAEAICLMDALWNEGKRARLRELLTSHVIAGSTDRSVVELREKYSRRLAQ